MRGEADREFATGIAARFEEEKAMVRACRRLAEEGFGEAMETYSPYPCEEVEEILAKNRRPVSRNALSAAMVGLLALGGFLFWSSVIDYPYQIGGRPTFSWPVFAPLLFEVAVLCGAGTAFWFATLGNGMPRWAHSALDLEGFEEMTEDGFLLWVDLAGQEDRMDAVAALLEEAGAARLERREGG